MMGGEITSIYTFYFIMITENLWKYYQSFVFPITADLMINFRILELPI